MEEEEGEKRFITLDTLVFSGGAVDALAFLGCVQYLEECQALAAVDTYIGTSAGAFIAFMMALGYTHQEMRVWAGKKFCESGANQIDIDNLLSSFEMMGIDPGHKLTAFMEDALYFKLGVRDMTLLDLERRCGKTLVACASNLTHARPEYFCAKTHPGLSLLTAVRASACIPYLFAPVRVGDCLYVDGGMFENLPLGACSLLQRHPARVLAMNLRWDIPRDLPRDIVEYSWYLVTSLLHRTNQLIPTIEGGKSSEAHDDSRKNSFTVVHIDSHHEQETNPESCGAINNSPFMGFCLDSMEFVIEKECIDRNIRRGMEALRNMGITFLPASSHVTQKRDAFTQT